MQIFKHILSLNIPVSSNAMISSTEFFHLIFDILFCNIPEILWHFIESLDAYLRGKMIAEFNWRKSETKTIFEGFFIFCSRFFYAI